jgi:hypothetical protein
MNFDFVNALNVTAPSGLEPNICSLRGRFRAHLQSQSRATGKFDVLPDGATT